MAVDLAHANWYSIIRNTVAEGCEMPDWYPTVASSEASSEPAGLNHNALRRIFSTLHAGSCPTSYNFHMHTVCSDGQLQPEQLVQQALRIGLQGFAITDHHTVDGYWSAHQWLEQERSQGNGDRQMPHLWTGVEVTSRMLDIEVHILGYAFDPESAYMQPYLYHCSPDGEDAQAEQVVACIHAAGGLAVLAHPVRYRRSPEELIPVAAEIGMDGVETFYAYNNPDPWHPSRDQTERVQRLSAIYNLFNTCGTDTHGLNLLQRL
jgi:predicted metal-dependent phosphoesterase TrpH